MTIALTPKDLYEGTRNLAILRAILSQGQHSRIRIAGKTVAVDMMTANAVVTVHDALAPQTRDKFCAMLAHSPTTFDRTVEFCWKHVV